MKSKIYILDDHPIVIEGLKKLIDQQEDMQVIGSAEDANTALQQIAKIKPDVVVLDITLKDRSGVDLIKKLLVVDPAKRLSTDEVGAARRVCWLAHVGAAPAAPHLPARLLPPARPAAALLNTRPPTPHTHTRTLGRRWSTRGWARTTRPRCWPR